MEPLLKGIISGITISLMIGPIFLALADITITKGWKSGLAYIAGILLSDLLLIYFVETVFLRLELELYKTPIALTGGVVLIVFGLVTFFSKVELKSKDVSSVKTLSAAVLKGFTINIFNPFVSVWWVTMYSTISINYLVINDKFLFYGGILLMVFLFDLIKMKFAYYLKQQLATQSLNKLKKIVGVCLILFGAAMLIRFI